MPTSHRWLASVVAELRVVPIWPPRKLLKPGPRHWPWKSWSLKLLCSCLGSYFGYKPPSESERALGLSAANCRTLTLVTCHRICSSISCIGVMAYTRDPVFRHGKFLVDSSGIDASLRPKYDYVLQEMAQADGITLLHAGLRTSAEDDLLILEPHCFDFDFQSAMKYFCTLEALMQADGIALGRQLRFQGKPCNTIEHRRVADTHVDGMSYQPGVEVLVTPKETEEDDDQWVDVSEELQSIDAVNQQSSLETRLASLSHDQKLAYLIVVREICEKDGLACNIGQAYGKV